MVKVPANLRFGEVIAEHWTLQQLELSDFVCDAYAAGNPDGERVRVFVLNRAGELTREVHKAFARSAWLANTVSHPAVPRVLTATQCEDGSPAVVTSGSDGESLAVFLARRRGRVAPTDAARIITEMLYALSSAHDRGVVHGHLRPDMCWLNQDGAVELLGLGWGRVALEAARHLGELSTLKPYRHPDRELVLESEEGDDLWAVGAVFFELLTGLGIEEVRSGSERLSTFFPSAPDNLVRFTDLLLTWNRDRPSNRALRLARMAQSLARSAELGRLLSLRSPVPPPPSFAPPPNTTTPDKARAPQESSPFLRHSEVARLTTTTDERSKGQRLSDSGQYKRTLPGQPTRPWSRSSRRGA